MSVYSRVVVIAAALVTFTVPVSSSVLAETWQERIAREPAGDLANAARREGDAARGAIVFFQPYLACSKCHLATDGEPQLGPDLTKGGKDVTDEYLVESILEPSKVIKRGYETVSLVTADGKTVSGLLVSDKPDGIVIRDASRNFRTVRIHPDDVEARKAGRLSLMPAGQIQALASRQQFLDLLKYLIEIRDGGASRAEQLQPPPSAYAARPLPDYEQEIDHAGMIQDLNQQSLKRGEAIYNRLCINCHGTADRPGSLPTSLRFASGKFKNGADPYTMYQTLTRGFGMMMPQTWMVPKQKYDVIHYIREAYLKKRNESQYFSVSPDYLAGLPSGTSRGPEPSNILPWEQMDYGPNLVATYEVGDDGSNFAYKGNAVRLDAGPGGVSRGRHWMVFDYDTLRVAAAWSGKGFINWRGINFDGRHNIHPRLAGQLQWENPTGPGWANPETGNFEDPRLRGRDDRAYGPLPRKWSHLKGMYAHGSQTVIAYTVGATDVLELPGLQLLSLSGSGEEQTAVGNANATGASGSAADVDVWPVFQRTFNLGPRNRPLTLQVAHQKNAGIANAAALSASGGAGPVYFGTASPEPATAAGGPVEFRGNARLDIKDSAALNMYDRDFTITARIKTRGGGTIFAKTAEQPRWVRDGKTFFVRNGQLAYDIGWVGVAAGKKRVNDGRWHHVAVSYDSKAGVVRLYVDGREDGRRELRPEEPVKGHVARIGFTSNNFPKQTYFKGQIDRVRFIQRRLNDEQIVRDAAAMNRRPGDSPSSDANLAVDGLQGQWNVSAAKNGHVSDSSGKGRDARLVVGQPVSAAKADGILLAGAAGQHQQLEWLTDGRGNLRLRIPAGADPLKFTIWTARVEDAAEADKLAANVEVGRPAQDLTALTEGGPTRWPETLKTQLLAGSDEGPFAVDVLTRPIENPWFCRLRLTGFDFFPDGDRAAVCSWDGNVWLVSGLSSGQSKDGQLSWRRIASGMFQPLGLKIIDGRIHVTCRDQLCVLHDLNGDGETDFYENLNNDHQVTDHFHEFAMGLQTDAEGNFYYAKSARHALPALVPHHGTLLRVSKDGSRTEILANGFRAANGVCLNPDGTFIVTDQEGHWNPKNRINWVEKGGFYGNMFGYHDVTDSSDDAMEPPLCWITNAFDRSPAELLWVDSPRWGPLNGTLLNLSYGYGKVYVVPHEEVDGQKQGGMCALPIKSFPTGVMRGRFHPGDGQLYLCGMFAWAGSQQQPGGFYRLRYTGKPVHLPVALHATKKGMQITFSGDLDEASATDPANYRVKVWGLKRTARYGSPHVNERTWDVAAARLKADGRTVVLDIPDMDPTWCMEIQFKLRSKQGDPVRGNIHNTVHRLGEAAQATE